MGAAPHASMRYFPAHRFTSTTTLSLFHARPLLGKIPYHVASSSAGNATVGTAADSLPGGVAVTDGLAQKTNKGTACNRNGTNSGGGS